MFRFYPGSPSMEESDGTCQNYDPRIRPWYIAAITGAKNVIIVIDRSASMITKI